MLGRLHLRSRLILKAAKAELRGDLMNERDCLEKYAFCQGQFTVPLGGGRVRCRCKWSKTSTWYYGSEAPFKQQKSTWQRTPLPMEIGISSWRRGRILLPIFAGIFEQYRDGKSRW